MELKSSNGYVFTIPVSRSNRTFMELKLLKVILATSLAMF